MPERPPLTPEHWDRVASCFDAALAVPSAERAGFVDRALPDDAAAQADVMEMLASATSDGALSIEPHLLADDDEDDALPTGTRLGAYRIDERIGRGGMGDVYRATRADGAFEQTVAIKLLRAGAPSRELSRRFATERRILARLSHPHIVPILDGGRSDDGRLYLAMPLVEGLSIIAYCDSTSTNGERVRRPLDERLRLFLQVTDAVQYAHTQLVVHRDIKPSNILVTAAGDVRLLDFGIAKLLTEDDADGSFPSDISRPMETRSGQRLLTPEHASPEQLRNESVTVSTDVYALGVLLYQLLTGTRPHVWAGRSLRELEHQITDVEPQLPSVAGWDQPWQRRLRGELDRIVMMALRKEPERRYATAAQFGEDIARLLDGRPVLAERDTVAYRARKFVSRNRIAVSVAATVLTLLVVFAVSSARQARALARERDIAQRETLAADNVVALLTSFFNQANPSVVPGGDTMRVAQLLTFAEARVDSLNSSPQVQARMWRVLGNMHGARGRADLALTLLRRSYEQFMRLTGSDSLEVAQTYHELARAVDGYEGAPKSLPMFEQSLARFKRLLPDNAPDVETVQRELAVRQDNSAAPRQVLERLASAKALASVTDPIQRAERIDALAQQRLASGDIVEAIALFEEALRLVDLKLPADHPNRLIVFGNLAEARRFGGDFDAAASLTRERLAQQQASRPVNPLALAAALEGFAAIQAERGFLEEAETRERDALSRWRTQLVPTHPSIWIALQNLSLITASRGRAREGLAYIDSALALAQTAGIREADHLWYLDLRAEMLLRAHEWSAAATALRALTPRIDAAFPAGHSARYTHRLRLGALALAQQRPSAALSYYEEARAAMASRVPATTPTWIHAECGRGVALARVGRLAEAQPLLDVSCEQFRAYGTHFAPLVEWARGGTSHQRP